MALAISAECLAQSHIQALPGHPIFQAVEPQREFVGALDREHWTVVVIRLHRVNQRVQMCGFR